MATVHPEQPPSQGTLGIDTDASSHPPTNALANEGRALDPHTSIPEEDESNETASESQEPLTPSSEVANHDFHHHEGNGHIDPPAPTTSAPPNADMKLSTPFGPASKPIAIPRSNPDLQRQPTAASSTPPSHATPPREGLGRRMGSFMKKSLSRTHSHTPGAASPPQGDGFGAQGTSLSSFAPPSAAAQARERPSLDVTSVVPKPRRFSSFSLSGRNTPASQSTSPPSPISPSSTINSEQQSSKAPNGHKYSRSHTGFSNATANAQARSRPGITWGIGHQKPSRGEATPKRPHRRRSASTEIVPKAERGESSSDDSLEGPHMNVTLFSTFSKHADEGTGMKARRLSTSLPDEFMVDFCDLKKEFKKVRPLKRKRVGQGATAHVFLYANKNAKDDRLYAVKEFRPLEKGESQDDYEKKVKSEFSIAKSLHHPNIVETVRLCTENGRWNHVMEYCDNGELFGLVDKGLFFKFYKYEDRMCFFKQLVRGVCYLHDHGIAHRDIKLENLLLSKEGYLKISDFGVSEVFCGEHPGLRAAGGECGKNMGEVRKCAPGICGSLPYIAPEVLAKNGKHGSSLITLHPHVLTMRRQL
jgi:protein-serine/threonine kinase